VLPVKQLKQPVLVKNTDPKNADTTVMWLLNPEVMAGRDIQPPLSVCGKNPHKNRWLFKPRRETEN